MGCLTPLNRRQLIAINEAKDILCLGIVLFENTEDIPFLARIYMNCGKWLRQITTTYIVSKWNHRNLRTMREKVKYLSEVRHV